MSLQECSRTWLIHDNKTFFQLSEELAVIGKNILKKNSRW